MRDLAHPRTTAARPEPASSGPRQVPSDLSLVTATQRGDRTAYSELVRRYEEKMYSLVHAAVQNRDDALDLTQEVFIKAYLGLDRFNEKATFYTWLYRIAVNTCIDFARRRSRTPPPLSLSDEAFTEYEREPADTRPGSDPLRALTSKTLRGRVNDAMAALPEPFRTAVLLRDIEGLSQKEIAEITDCPVGTVKSRVQRGRQILRERLAPFIEATEPV